MSYAERNRSIKKVLTEAFGAGKVSVKGSRGTAAGWVTVSIAYAPKDQEEHDALKTKVWELFAAAKITIGTYGYDDPGSDYGFGKTINLEFEPCQDTFREGEAVDTCNGKSGIVYSRDYALGGDWYVVKLLDGSSSTFFKKDLTRSALGSPASARAPVGGSMGTF